MYSNDKLYKEESAMDKIRNIVMSAVIVLGFLLGMTSLGSASSEGTMEVGLGLGLYAPSDEAMKDIYGGGIALGGRIKFSLSENFDLVGGLDYFSKKGTPYYWGYTSAESTIRLITLHGGALLKFPIDPITPYIGGGLDLCFVHEEVSATSWWGTDEFSFSETNFGFHLLGGASLQLAEKISAFGELEYRSIGTKGEGAAENLGGLFFRAGIAFLLF